MPRRLPGVHPRSGAGIFLAELFWKTLPNKNAPARRSDWSYGHGRRGDSSSGRRQEARRGQAHNGSGNQGERLPARRHRPRRGQHPAGPAGDADCSHERIAEAEDHLEGPRCECVTGTHLGGGRCTMVAQAWCCARRRHFCHSCFYPVGRFCNCHCAACSGPDDHARTPLPANPGGSEASP